MLSQSRFSYLIELSQKLIVAVQSMMAGYQKFPRLIEEEHAMIRTHTYTDRLEEIVDEKMAVGDEITSAFEALQQLSQELFVIWGEAECEGQARYPGDLSNCIAMLEGIHLALSGRVTNLGLGVLDLQISRLKSTFAEFKIQVATIKPMIEVNRDAVSVIAQNYQNSTRVLLELCEQSQATYNPQGQQTRPSTGTSTIFVKA